MLGSTLAGVDTCDVQEVISMCETRAIVSGLRRRSGTVCPAARVVEVPLADLYTRVGELHISTGADALDRVLGVVEHGERASISLQRLRISSAALVQDAFFA